jgi:hypothetical protein
MGAVHSASGQASASRWRRNDAAATPSDKAASSVLCRFGELLAPVYGWFTEGFDTRDLKKAKTLLEQLAS